MQLVDAGQFAVAGGVQLLAPAAQLPVEEALGASEVAQADGLRVHGVQFHQGVDQAQHRLAGALRVQRGELLHRAVRGALDVLHHVERRADDRVVLAEQQGLGDRDGRRVQCADHPVLALHVMCGGQDMTQRRPADDPATGAARVRDDVRQVGAAALDEPGVERSVHQTRPLAVEVAAQPVEVETWRVDWAHRAHLRGEYIVGAHDADQSVCRPVNFRNGMCGLRPERGATPWR